MKRKLEPPSFKSVLISFSVVSLVLLAITGMGCIRSVSYVKKEIEKSAEFQMKSVVTQIENKMQQTYKVCDALIEGKVLEEFENIEENFSPEEIINTIKLREVMEKINLQHDLYQNLYVYFYNSDSIVSEQSQRRSGEADMELFCKTYEITKQEFLEMLTAEQGYHFKVLSGNLFWVIRPVYDEKGELKSAVIAEFAGDKLLEEQPEENRIVIQTEDGIISCAGNMPEEKGDLLNVGEGLEQITLEGGRYVAMQQKLKVFGWKCSMAVPNTLFWGEMKRFQGMMIIETLILLGVGMVSSWYFSKRTYVPIEILMKDNKQLSKKVHKNEKIIKSVEITKYLTGERKEEGIYRLLKGHLAWEERSGYLVCVLTMGEEENQIFKPEESIEQQDLKIFVLENILEEQLFLKFPGILVPVRGKYTVILRVEGEAKEQEEVKHIFKKITDYYKTNFKISVCAIMGDIEYELSHVKTVYEKLIDGLQYMEFWKSGDEPVSGIFFYGEMIETDENVKFSNYMNGSRKLLNCLESEDFSGAYQELDGIYRETFSKDQRYLKYNVYRMYGLIGILITTLDTYANEEDREFFEGLCYEDRLFRIQSMNDLMIESRKIFESIIQYKESHVKEGMPEWLDEMLAYIEKNYQDSNLNVSGLADVFEISVPHLSRTFKNVMDKGVLEYIHRVRIEHAKGMLERGDNIKDVASATGYTDTRSITRAFKRYEGITPSQYKELKSGKD